MSEVRCLDLADYLLIAEAVLGTRAEDLARIARLELAESALASLAAQFGGVEFYPDFADKVAVGQAGILAGDVVLTEWGFEHPDWYAAPEVDPELSVATRIALLPGPPPRAPS